jgi:tRNA(fMet)-specific endonuclease VapC
MSPRYLIDTDIFIHIRQQRLPQLRARFEQLQPGEAAISVVVYGELLYGIEKSQDRARALKSIDDVVALVPVLPMTLTVAREYGVLTRALEKQGQKIGNNDLWIAAHALAEGLTLATANEREFRRVPRLKMENWVVRGE